ncbi:threonine-phosphate decarboxylase [Halocalculus aciditolerans]|uniref:Aminotransferase n=1 Tax=Halocalculus aciditolerans TaxID=1383812 RepID=A0A830FLX9_9EURY|nr:threonine-phosphate decarboxylase [Halocalculus aciditolerans]GGL65706.1 threonine-phosphate decarboxylase [Halocalculus aciditolerans]
MEPDAVRRVGREPHGSSDDPDLVDFSANTNPRVPDGVREVYAAALDAARTYPEEPPRAYRDAAADYVGCARENVVSTPGGLAAIRLAIEVSVTAGDDALVPAPSFAEYAREVRLQGATPDFVPHDEILGTDPSEYALAVVCNPNNPTGECYDPDALRAFADRCARAGTPLLVDEAFLGFTGSPSLAGRDGVVVARSLTKLLGLPGIRAGFAVATGDEYERLAAARRTWNLGAPALAVGEHCMRDEGFVADTRRRVRRERERLRRALDEHYDVFPSDSPFLLLDVGSRDVGEVVGTARERGVAVRDATTFRGLDSHVRVAVRTREENDRLLEALDV